MNTVTDHIPINYHLMELAIIEDLSERAKNVCLDNSLDCLFKVLEYYKVHDHFLSMRKCGKKTNDELVGIARKYIEKYGITPEKIQANEHHRTFEEYKLFCFEHFSLSSHEAEAFRHAFLKGRFPFFQFLLLILKKLLNKKEHFIFEHNFRYFKNKKKHTLQAIGNRFNITRERIRQISHDMPFKIRNIFSPFADELFFIENHLQYKLERYKDYILIDEKTEEQINKEEELECTARFYAFGFAMLYYKHFYYFQEPLKIYKQYYLINRKLAKQFDFAEFYHNLSGKANTRTPKEYTIDFRHYVRSFYRPGKFSYFERIVDMCKQIALGEFGFRCNVNDELLIMRNTKIKLSEHITQILEDMGRPMHIKEIAAELKKRQLKFPPSIESLRSSVLVLDNVLAIGKTSTYSLASWDHVQTGTIKKIAKEYLEKQDYPVHLLILCEHINKFRKTKEKNVYSNLKLDRSGTFVFFKKAHIGLSSKKYTSMSPTKGQLSLL